MNILITGSSGFVGKHLMTALKASGHTILGVDKKEGLNIANFPELYKTVKHFMPNVEMIVHLAANCSTQHSIDHPNEDFSDNLIGTFNICELSKELKVPVVYTSTCKVMENWEGARTPYGLSKYCGELYLLEYNKMYQTKYLINRPGTMYGPGQEGSTESGWLAWFIKASLEKEPITIYGDGKQTRDLLYVKDYVRLLVDQVEHFEEYWNSFEFPSHTFSVGGGEANEVSLLQMLEHLGYSNYNFGKERKGDIQRFVADNEVSKVRGWKPKKDWKEGVEETLSWYVKNVLKN